MDRKSEGDRHGRQNITNNRGGLQPFVCPLISHGADVEIGDLVISPFGNVLGDRGLLGAVGITHGAPIYDGRVDSILGP